MKRLLVVFGIVLVFVASVIASVTVSPSEIKVSRVGEITIVITAEESYSGVAEVRVTVPFDRPSVMSNKVGWFAVKLSGKGKLIKTAVENKDIILSITGLKVNDKIIIVYGSKIKKGVGVKALKAGIATFVVTLGGQSVTTSVNVLK